MTERRAAGARPNIVLILCDDMGFSDVGCFGSEIPTPHIDALAARGLRLTQMYNTARCCPSRASLLTGLYPTQAGIGHMTETGTPDIPGYEGRLTDHAVTMAEALAAGRYQTAMVGKWHVGGPLRSGPLRPTERGFRHFFGTLPGAGSYFQPHGILDGDEPYTVPEDFYYTDVIGDRACSMIDDLAAGDDPFFLYVAHVAPHWPLHATPRDIDPLLGAYREGWDAVRTGRHDRLRDAGLVERTWTIASRDDAAPQWSDVDNQVWEDARMAVYAAQVVALDRSVGAITAKLLELGIEDDTLVVFLSDNGGCAEVLPTTSTATPGPRETFLSYGLPWAQASNTPFRRYKHWVHEGGISTPFVASWPGVIPAGGVSHEPAHIVDLMTTFLDVAGAPYPDERGELATVPLEGRSLVPVFEGGSLSRSGGLFWEHEGHRAVRDGDLKLVAVSGGEWELYRMDLDRTEADDLAARYPRDVQRLESMYAAWAERTGVIPWDELLPRLPPWPGTGGGAG